MSVEKLILLPEDPLISLGDSTALVGKLQEVGLLGKSMNYFGYTRYETGASFLDLIEFRSSHKVIVLTPCNGGLVESEPRDSRQFCHVEFWQIEGAEEFLGTEPTRPPLCRTCNYENSNWPDMLSDWYKDKRTFFWKCLKCGQQARVHELNWRHSAGFGRSSLDIWGIRPGEAIPSKPLLQLLRLETGTSWTYFYYRI